MQYTLLAVSFSLLMGVCGSVQAANNTGQIRFSGQIVEAACEVGAAGTVNVGSTPQEIRVAPNVSVSVGTAGNACSGAALPFAARYEPLPDTAPGVVQASHKGIVVITYL